ncbi:MAG: hypothetical protein KME30_31270 [Iphinoe sp. HA4291-MV1]|jgi:hypothetical protein|nr:hypothetical protein [Iphinoe sp. HA4291-MV1]
MPPADDNKSYLSPAGLTPEDSIGQRFLQYFHHQWGFIFAPVPSSGDRPGWQTETRYPLQPRNLWSRYQNPGELLGLRFGNITHYFLADIDAGSAYHPVHHLENFNHVLATLETIGLTRYLLIRSSPSGGIHVYFFFKEKLDSFYLAYAAFLALQQAGIQVKGGQLELFPNPKPYGKDKPTNFNAHRLPLQEGSYILENFSFAPYSDNLEDFLNAADWSAEGQDYELLHQALAHAKTQSQQRFTRKYTSNAAQLWRRNLEERIQQGWTDFHQTNELLKDIACYGIVFRKLSGSALVDYVVTTAEAAPGYRTWCRHQHEIRKRATERARNCEGYYTPYCSIPNRLCSYREQFGEANNVVPFSPNQQRHAQTFARVSAAVTALKKQGEFPETISARTKAIIEVSKTLYGIGVSQTTLHKPNYLPLWHPLHEKERVNADVVQVLAPQPPEKYPQLPDPWLAEPNPETLTPQAVESDSNTIYTLPPYMKGLCLPPAAVEVAISIDKHNLSQPSPREPLTDHKPALSIEQIPDAPVASDDSHTSQSYVDSEPAINLPVTQPDFNPASAPVSVPDSTQTFVADDLPLDRNSSATAADQAFFADLLSAPVNPSRGLTRTRDSQPYYNEYPTEPSDQQKQSLLHFLGDNASAAVSGGAARFGGKLPPKSCLDNPSLLKRLPKGHLTAVDASTFTPEQHRQAASLRVQAMIKAKDKVKWHCLAHEINLILRQRQELEQLVVRILIAQSGSTILWLEAREWFSVHWDALKRQGLGWISQLLFPDLFG